MYQYFKGQIKETVTDMTWEWLIRANVKKEFETFLIEA